MIISSAQIQSSLTREIKDKTDENQILNLNILWNNVERCLKSTVSVYFACYSLTSKAVHCDLYLQY